MLWLKSNKFKLVRIPKQHLSASENPMDINVGVLAHFWKLLLWKSSFCIFRVVLNWGHVILPEVLNIAVNDQIWFHSSLCPRLCNLQILFSEHETIIISIGILFLPVDGNSFDYFLGEFLTFTIVLHCC